MRVRTDRIESVYFSNVYAHIDQFDLHLRTFSGKSYIRTYKSEAKRNAAAKMITSFKVFWLKVDD